jgi:DNA-binding NarL/FixJ family response regulator
MADIRVVLVEDETRTREGLTALIGGSTGFAVSGAYGSVEELLEGLDATPPDVVLTDIGLPGMSGIEGVRRLRERFPGLLILMLTVYSDDDHIFEAICAGACGYLLKDTPPARLLESIREVVAGGAPMSPGVARRTITMFRGAQAPPAPEHALSARELDVLSRLADGHSYKTAAHDLSVSVDTVRFHIRNIYQKLHVHSKSEAVIAALRRGIIR